MAKRVTGGLIVMVTLVLSAATASAYPPGSPEVTSVCVEPGVTGNLPPGGIGALTVTCDAIEFGDVLSGTFGPLRLPPTPAQGDGFVTFTVDVPSDFRTDQSYVLGLLDEDGRTIGSTSVYVAPNGSVGGPAVAPSGRSSRTPGRLVRTGSDLLPAKVGLGLVAAGGLTVLTVRKRRRGTVPPS